MKFNKSYETETNHEIGTWQTWKFGIASRDIYRIDIDEFEINETINGWKICIVNKTTLLKLYNAEICISQLKWI
jgi:hypothetical protein